MIYVNFLPWRTQFYPRKIKNVLLASGLMSLFTATILGGFYLTLNHQQQQFEQQLTALKQMETTLNQAINQRVVLQKKIDELKQREKNNNNSIGIEQQWVAQFMQKMIHALPDDVWLTELDIQQNQWRILGKSQQYHSIIQLNDQLDPLKNDLNIEQISPIYAFELAGKP